LACVLDLSPKHVNELIKDKKPITLSIAKHIAVVFDDTSLEQIIKLHIKSQPKKPKENEVYKRAIIYDKMPVNELFKKGWLKRTSNVRNLEKQALGFWNTKNIRELKNITPPAHRYKKSEAYKNFSFASAYAWQQYAMNCASQLKRWPTYDKKRLQNILDHIYSYTLPDDGVAMLIKDFKKAGVKFIMLSHLKKTYLDGGAFMNKSHPVIVYTGRYNRIDNFFFCVAHEIIHILHHLPKADDVFYLDDNSWDATKDKDEREADRLAARALLKKKIIKFFSKDFGYVTDSRIMECSERFDIHPAIIAGSLAYDKKISYSHLHRYTEPVKEQIPKEHVMG